MSSPVLVALRPAPSCPRGHRWQRCKDCRIRDLALCGALNPAELGEMEAICMIRSVSAGQALELEGDPVEYAYNVVAGSLKLYKSLQDGRTQVTGFLLPADFLGLPSRGEHPYSVEALSDSVVRCFPRERLEGLFDRMPALRDRFRAMIDQQMRQAQEQFLLLGRKTSDERLASFLLDLENRFARIGDPTRPMLLPMNRSEIAQYLGVTLETVSRSFTRLKRQELIELPKPDRVSLLQHEALRALSEGL